jgi:hypothetical protein
MTKKTAMDGKKKSKSIWKEKAAPQPVEEKPSSNKVSVFASVSIMLLAILRPVQNAWKSNGETEAPPEQGTMPIDVDHHDEAR